MPLAVWDVICVPVQSLVPQGSALSPRQSPVDHAAPTKSKMRHASLTFRSVCMTESCPNRFGEIQTGLRVECPHVDSARLLGRMI